jgi:hypothetical protein
MKTTTMIIILILFYNSEFEEPEKMKQILLNDVLKGVNNLSDIK